jgi:cellulose synthase operon protein C
VTALDNLQQLYDRHRFLDAFQQSAEYWKPSTSPRSLSLDELILGGRLAVRLGGGRLSRRLFRIALERDPSNSRVRYFSNHVRRRRSRTLDDLRAFEADPNACADDPETQASWLASHAITWAYLRDFTRAHHCLERAHAIGRKDGWVNSCESDVLGIEDRWDEALHSAEQAWAMNPGAPFAARSLTISLLNLRRVHDSAQWLAAAAQDCQSYEIVHLAGWYHCALAETLEGNQRRQALDCAQSFAEQLPALLPLADRESRSLLARTRLDIAELSDDHEQMQRWAKEVRIPFYRRVLENLRKHPALPRIRLPFRRAVQKHQACLPTALSSALATLGVQVDPDAMAAEITFGGTSDWSAAEWLEKRGLTVRFFAVTDEVAATLIKHGIAFVLTLEGDDNAHAVAVVGLDEAAGTLLVHDPMGFRTTEYLLETFAKKLEPLGLKGMVAVPPEKVALLDELLPRDDVAMMTAAHLQMKAFTLQGPTAAREIAQEIALRLPSHPGTRLLSAIQAAEDGRTSDALLGFQQLLNEFPHSPSVRVRLILACRALGNTALTRDTLAGVVERGVLPGVQSQQDWLHPPARYVAEYADLLHYSAATRERASSLLHTLIRRAPTSAEAWHVLADLLWSQRDVDAALLAYRLASCQAVVNEHYALAYSDALGAVHREEEGFSWLEQRVHRFGAVSRAASTWITWISALEEWGHPEGALSTCADALAQHSTSTELLTFVVPFFARMGRWEEAENLLDRLEKTGNLPLFYEAAVAFYRLRGNLQKSLQHAQAWVREVPRHMGARYALVDLVSRHEGARAAIALAAQWVAEHPGHDQLEMLYHRHLDGPAGSKVKKYSLLLRRVKRNPEDGWAWRELALRCINDYGQADDQRRARLRHRVLNLIAQCDRTSPGDPVTLRVRGRWHEVSGQWQEAVDVYVESINLDPGHPFGYQRAWECSTTFTSEQRHQLWEKIEPMLLACPGHLSIARELLALLAQRFGVVAAEQAITRWKQARPDDPEVTEAYASLLLDHGQGRPDATRALAMLQPAVEHYPHHVALRSLLSIAHRRLGNFAEAEQVLLEILRRHPDNSPCQTQLAWVREREGKSQDAREMLQSAAADNPQDLQISDSLVQLVIRAKRFNEARSLIAEVLQRAPEDVNWRERSIRFLIDSGDEEAAVAAAREGVRVHPRGAYMWYLLGITLNQLRRFAGPGEIELCFRHSVSLNALLFDAADQLSLLLLEQRRYDEAAEVMWRILPRLSDPSPAKGRLAWIHRQQGQKREAPEELASTVLAVPWYHWGWSVLMEWLIEDQSWDQARTLLGVVPPELRNTTQLRRRRLVVLERAGLPATELKTEWDSLLHDFPEEVALHLHRYDLLRQAKQIPEAHAVLKAIRSVEPDNPYVLARYVEVLAEEQDDEKRKEKKEENKSGEALDALQSLLFAEAETSNWPADYAWEAIKRAHLVDQAFLKMRSALENGSRPTHRGFFIISSSAFTRGKTQKLIPQPGWRIWFPDRGAKELLELLALADRRPWMNGRYRAQIFDRFSSVGYFGLVLNYWKKHKDVVEADGATWAETARAMVSLGLRAEARKLLTSWRTRPGVGMWVVTNYVQSFSPLRSNDLRQVTATCRDALKNLPHDHCARYLAHVEAEAYALLGDKSGFLETWNHHRSYFDCRETEGEWFENKRKHLLTDIPMMARYLQQNKLGLYRRTLWGWRWNYFWDRLVMRRRTAKFLGVPWWTWFIFFFWLSLLVIGRLSGS